jgi:ABC-type dipeptide/oligopeptide/nickel transport system ATPase component
MNQKAAFDRKLGSSPPTSQVRPIQPDHILAINDLCIDFRGRDRSWKRAVQNATLSVARGSFTAVIGESGSGKSATCLATLGLVHHAAKVRGTITFNGVAFDAASMSMCAGLRGSGIGMIFQDPFASLNPVRTIGSQLVETIRVHTPRVSRDGAGRMAISLLDRVGLDQAARRLKQYCHELSGGMNQRVMIALALASNPKLLVADEPTTALDARTQRQVMELIDDLRRTEGLSVLLVSHDLRLVWEYADMIHIMREGQVVGCGSGASLLAGGAHHPYVRQLTRAAGLAA